MTKLCECRNLRAITPRALRRSVRRSVPWLVLVGAGVAVMAPSTASATVVTRDTIIVVAQPDTVVSDCDPTLTGTITGQGTFSFQTVENVQGFHAVVLEAGTGRIDWNDGTYTLITSVDRSSFNGVRAGSQTFTLTHLDTGDTYAADGTALGKSAFQEVQHITVTNGGIVQVSIEFGHFTAAGGC
jgi:hypothetical protein